MKINIAYGATENWIKYACISIFSILRYARSNDVYHFYIMSSKFSKETKHIFSVIRQYFSNTLKIHFHFLKMNDDDFDGLIHDWLGVSASYRLKLSTLVSEDKIIYLDCDTLIRKDISNLFLYNIENYYIGMVEDKCSEVMKSRVNLYGPNDIFFNSGVSIINLKAFRENDIENKLFESLKNTDFYTDQDALNFVCKGNILSLPLTWNTIYPLFKNDSVVNYPNRINELKIAQANPAILHFSTKPWDTNNEALFSEWFSYKKEIEELLSSSK